MEMNNNRRNFLRGLAFAGSGFVAGRKAAAQHQHHEPAETQQADLAPSAARDEHFLPVHTPDIPKFPYELDNGVKVFHLIAEPVKREFVPASAWSPARVVDAWGYNGSVPGPTIEVTEGDRVRIIADNHLPEPTSVHWHGFEIPIEMDGVPGLTQDPIPPGGRFVYEFTLHQKGTFFYHSHMPMQGNAGNDRYVHHASEDAGTAAGGQGLWAHPSGVGHPTQQHDSQHLVDGVQLADVERKGGPCDDALDCEAGRTGTDSTRESGNGSSPDAPPRGPVRYHGHGGRKGSAIGLVSDEHSAGGGCPGQRHRV